MEESQRKTYQDRKVAINGVEVAAQVFTNKSVYNTARNVHQDIFVFFYQHSICQIFQGTIFSLILYACAFTFKFFR